MMIPEVHDNYTTARHPTAFSAPGNLKNFYERRYGVKPILETLRHIDAYTHFREVHKPRVSNPFYTYKRRQQVQMDLIDVGGLKRENDNVTFLLVAIDTFTKYVWVRPLKFKSAVHVLAALKSILAEMGEKPETVFFDHGREFTNRRVTAHLREQGIRHQHPSSEKKAAVVERCNRTLQGILYRFLAHHQTRNYTSKLANLIDSYNHRVHRSIKMTPAEAETDVRQPQVLAAHNEHYAKIARKRKKPKYVVGDKVLVANIAKSRFRRGYEQSFNFEQFEIVEVKTNMPVPMYILKSLNDNEVIEGGFYAEELQVIRGDVFKVDKVLRRRRYRGKNQVFVTWRGFDAVHDQWIDESDLVADYE